jgi:hypothetical protein
VLDAGLLKAPMVAAAKTGESQPIHLTIGIGRYLHMLRTGLIAHCIEPFLEKGHAP